MENPQFTKFTFQKIYTYINDKGVEKKEWTHVPWKHITHENMVHYNLPHHNGHAIICGKISGITVLDFDKNEIYDRLLSEYPDLKKHFTVKTNNGYHIYFNYDPSFKEGQGAAVNVDIRNDGGIVFCPPTKYKRLDGTEVGYEYLGGELLPIPDIMNQYRKIEDKAVAVAPKRSHKKRKIEEVSVKDTEIEVKAEEVPVKVEYDLATLEEYKLLEPLLDKNRFAKETDWVLYSLAMLHEFGSTEECVNMWDTFSALCPHYDKNKNLVKWKWWCENYAEKNTIKANFGLLKKWAKIDNPEKYKELYPKSRLLKRNDASVIPAAADVVAVAADVKPVPADVKPVAADVPKKIQHLFGSNKEKFNPHKVMALYDFANTSIYGDKTIDERIKMAQDYIRQYFIKLENPVGIYKYEPHEPVKLVFFTYEELGQSQMPKGMAYCMCITKVNKKGQTVEHEIEVTTRSWFLEQDLEKATVVMDVTQPLVFHKRDTIYVNIFVGYMHLLGEKPLVTPDDMKTAIDKLWQHVKEVLCSNNEDQFKYCKSWLCHMIAGRKMKTCLYFRGPMGVGKSIIFNFIRKNVLGAEICHRAENTQCLASTFNGELYGKCFLLFEELKTSTNKEWEQMCGKMNSWITDEHMCMRALYKQAYQTKNYMSIVVLANEEAIKVARSNDRRYVVFDVSDHRTADFAYFKEFAKVCNDEVGRYFYWYCVDFAAKDTEFEEDVELKQLDTLAKRENLCVNLIPFFVFLKNEYLAERKDLNVSLKTLHLKYNTLNEDNKLCNIAISKLLKEDLGITGSRCTTGDNKGCWQYAVSFAKLYEIFEKKKWLHYTDVIDKPVVAETPVVETPVVAETPVVETPVVVETK